MRLVKTCTALLAFSSLLPAAFELNEANRVSIERVESRGDSFIGKLKTALDRSTWNGTRVEDRLNHWNDILEKATDGMKDGMKAKDAARVERNLEHALIVGAGLNRVMLRNEFSSAVSADWNDLRGALNDLAQRSGRPGLPDLVVTSFTLSPDLLDRSEVKDVMKRLEASTDRFKDKFDQSIKGGRKTEEYKQYADWADTLEDVSDQMLDHYNHRDEKKFDEWLQTTLMFSEAINRLMLTREVFGNAPQEWVKVREDLNRVAVAFGEPPLAELQF
jgi:hypothetical protein